jgi:hypothetical protein
VEGSGGRERIFSYCENRSFLIVKKLEAGLQFLSRFSLRETIQTIVEAY